MKPSRTPWVELRYPLIDMGLTREDCFKITVEAGVPVGRSSCVFCPYHGDRYWRQLAKEAPQDFLEACKFDQSLRAEGTGLGGGIDGVPFVHPSLRPLAERPFDQKLPEGMSNECEGYCGL